MSIEDALAKLTAAVEANTAAIKAGAGKPAADAPPAKPSTESKGKGNKETPPAKPKNDRSAVNAALEKVKEDKGVEDAKKIIAEVGGVAARKDIPEDKFDAVVDACKKVLDGAGTSNDDDDL